MNCVLITGGARGIGRAIAERFLQSDHWNVALMDLDEVAVVKAADELNKLKSGRAFACQGDVTDRTSVDNVVKRTVEKFGRVDCLINNAGITADAMVYKMTEDNFDKVIAVNLKGVYNCTQSVLAGMLERGKGNIINTSSVVGLYGNMGQTNYAATKAGLIGMTKTWAKELGRKGIRVNAVAPGFTLTEMVKTIPEKVLNSIAAKTPLQRLAEPSEVANAFYFLASEEASFITGHTVSVDGGIIT